MRWLKGFALLFLALILARAIILVAAPLPSLDNRTSSQALAETNDTPLGRAIASATQARPGLSGIHLLPDAVDAFAARMVLARAAARSLDAQYYIWRDDLTGTLLFSELRAAAERGVRVRLLLDDNNTPGLDPILAALDAHPNIEVRLFNPFVIRGPRLIGYFTDFSRLNRRMHNKSFTADNQATIIGGRNIGDEYFGTGGGALFVDLDALAVGPVVRDVSRDFDLYWASASAYPADRLIPALDAARRGEAEARLASPRPGGEARRYLDAVRERPLVEQLLRRQLALDWAPVRMISDDPAKGLGRTGSEAHLALQLSAAMGEPEREVDLVSGYFVPAQGGTQTLAGFAERGVEVTVLTNAFEATDVPIVHAGYVKRRKPLLRAGVRLFELRGADAAQPADEDEEGGSVFGSSLSGSGSALHAKTIVADQDRLFVGSFNFDPRSAHLNTELGFVIESPMLARRVHQAIRRQAPARAYEVRLSEEDELYWIERREGRETRHRTEPGMTGWDRAWTWLLSLLPIEWML